MDLNNLYTRLGRIEALLESISEKLESSDNRMDQHEERLSKVEHHKTAMMTLSGVIGGTIGWIASHLPKLLMTALLVLAMTSDAKAQSCKTVDDAIAHIHAINPIAVHVRLDDMQTAAFVRWFNRQPPPSDDRWTVAVVLRHADGNFGILLGENGEVCHAFRVPPNLVELMMRAISGDDV